MFTDQKLKTKKYAIWQNIQAPQEIWKVPNLANTRDLYSVLFKEESKGDRCNATHWKSEIATSSTICEKRSWMNRILSIPRYCMKSMERNIEITENYEALI